MLLNEIPEVDVIDAEDGNDHIKELFIAVDSSSLRIEVAEGSTS